MIKINNISLPINFTENDLIVKSAKILGIPISKISECRLSRLSIDARKKSDVHYVCSVILTIDNEEKILPNINNKDVSFFRPKEYHFPQIERKSKLRPIVVGMGPAGLFAALHLARAGLSPIIIERGRNVEKRTEDVENFWKTGKLSLTSNVQFGEGGAGTFSDGKLTTGINDMRIFHVFETLVEHGAPEDILWSNKPHVGTDILRNVVKSIRNELLTLGCDIRFENRLCGLKLKQKSLLGVYVISGTETYEIPCDTLVLAPGHSSRDTFSMLFDSGVPMEQKSFAIGVRIEHKQSDISISQYGGFADKLPPADYKLSCHLPNGRSAYTFCVCPGGQVIGASSNHNCLVTNGMSLRKRNGENINAAFLVGVGSSDFEDKHPLSGMKFQEFWENRAFIIGGGDYSAPIQTLRDFSNNIVTTKLGGVFPTYRPGVKFANIRSCLPKYISETLYGALPVFENSLHGFANPDAVMTGIETRSSSPVRILRGKDYESEIKGIYPCGEGAGYAGGITSAAVDGIRVAEAIAIKP